MCPFVRWTARRMVRSSCTLRLSWAARRSRAVFLSIIALAFSSLLLLGFLEHDALVGVAHALALVRLRRTVGTDLRRDLPHQLLVHALEHDLRLRRRLDLHALRHRVHDGV